MRSIRREKKNEKKKFEDETCAVKKPKLKEIYMKKQGELRTQIEYEHNDAISKKFSSMIDQGKNGFWKEVKRSKRDKMSEWISIKDANGDGIPDPERQKERIASYYENCELLRELRELRVITRIYTHLTQI